MIFHSHANKPHFHKTGCVLGLVLKVRVYELGTGLLPSMCSAHLHITELKKNWPQKSWKNRENATKSTLHKVMNNALIPVFEKIPPWPAKFPLHSHETVRPLYQPTQSKSNKKKYGIAKLSKIVIECFHMTSRWLYWCPKTMKRRPCWCPKKKPLGVELFSYANAFFCSNKFA